MEAITSKQVNIQSDQKYAKSHSFAKNDYSDVSKSIDSIKLKYSSDKERLTQQVFQYGVVFVMIVLFVMLVHLHTRIAALESSGVSLTPTGCQCEKTIVTHVGDFNGQSIDANNGIVDSNNKDANEQIAAYFDNEKREPSTWDDTAEPVIDSEGSRNILSNKKHPIFKAWQGKDKSIDRMHSENTAVIGNFKSKSNITNVTAEVLNKASNNSTDQSSSTDGNSTEEAKSVHNFRDSNFKTVDIIPQINKIQRVELTDYTTDTTGQELSRIKRSHKIKDQTFSKTVSTQRRRKQENHNTGPQVENFDVPFTELFFNYLTHFVSQELERRMKALQQSPWRCYFGT